MHKLLVLLLALTMLAGCSDSPTASTAEEVDPASPEGLGLQATDTTGLIRGVVVDDAIVPVPDARIRIGSLGLETVSNHNGAFGFDGLEPGTYFLEASKLGFVTAQAAATVETGVAMPPVIKLQLLHDLNATPYYTPYQWTGFMECSTSVLQVCGAPNTAIQTFCEGGVPPFCDLPQEVTGDDFLERFDVDRPPNWVQAELVWESTQMLGDGLTLIMEAYRLQGLGFEGLDSAGGPSPVLVTADAARINNTSLGKEGGANPGLTQLQLRVFADGSDTTAGTIGVVAQQKFEAFVHIFYGYAPTDGWRFTDNPGVPGP